MRDCLQNPPCERNLHGFTSFDLERSNIILIIFTQGCSFQQFQNGLVESNLCFWLWQEKWSKNQYIASICYGRTASWRAWQKKWNLHIPSRYSIPVYPTWDLLIFICYDLQGSQFWIKWWVSSVSIPTITAFFLFYAWQHELSLSLYVYIFILLYTVGLIVLQLACVWAGSITPANLLTALPEDRIILCT